VCCVSCPEDKVVRDQKEGDDLINLRNSGRGKRKDFAITDPDERQKKSFFFVADVGKAERSSWGGDGKGGCTTKIATSSSTNLSPAVSFYKRRRGPYR